jgi:MFS family permease
VRSQRVQNEWLTGGPMVLTCLLGGFANWAPYVALGSLILVLNEQFGWTRTQVTSATTVLTLTTILFLPPAGRAIDRWGARKPILIGLCLVPVTFVLIGLSGPQFWTWLAAWLIAGTIGAVTQPPIWAAGLVSRFKSSRGLSLGVAALGVAAANSVVPLIAVTMTHSFGWRSFFFGLAAFVAFIVLPLAAFFLYDASDITRRDRAKDGEAAVAADAVQHDGLSMGEVFRSVRYWQLVALLILTGASVGALVIHMQPILRGLGLTAIQAAGLMVFYGLGGLVGRLVGGGLLDRFSRGPMAVLPTAFLPAIAALIFLAKSDSRILLALAPFCVGCASGLEVDLIPYLGSRYFGLRNFGTIYTSLSVFFVVGFGVAPTLSSMLFDTTGSYFSVLIAIVVAGLASTVLLGLLGRYPDRFSQNTRFDTSVATRAEGLAT